tara:strand:- start:20652 stop:21413 length:762 start_codon:yes stop_codon:yes gene_type:complete
MAIDMKKMRERKNALENKGGNNNRFWRPQDGEQTIRIVPTADGDPFKDYWFHYNVGDNPGFLSPKRNFGEDCPLDSFVRQLWQEGTEDSKRMAKKLSARQRFFAPVVVRGEEDKGVRVWGFGKTVYETLLNLVLNPEYGDITDAESGTDLVLTYGKPAGAQFPVTQLTPRRRSSSLCKEPERCREFLDDVPDFDELFSASRKSFAEVQAMLDEFLLGDSDPEENSTETTKYDGGEKEKSSTSVDQAFADLLGS